GKFSRKHGGAESFAEGSLEMKITSVTNPRIKQIVKLKDHQHRRQSGLTIIEGSREVGLALNSVQLEEVYVCLELLRQKEEKEVLKRIEHKHIVVYEISKEIFRKISFGDRQDGMLALCHPIIRNFADLKEKKNYFFVVIDHVEKPGNLGAVLRTCDAA